MRLLPCISRMAGTVQMQDDIIPARPFGHGLDRRIADDKIDHDDNGAELLREIGALVHVLHRGGGGVQIRALHLAR